MEEGLKGLATLHKIPYIHVHMAFFTFHKAIDGWLRRHHPKEDRFRITRMEIVLITYLYGHLPGSLRLRGNLTYVLHALLAFYFSNWGVDFVPLTLHKMAALLNLKDQKHFENLVVYLCVHCNRGIYSIAQPSTAYDAWEDYLFPKKDSNV